MAFGLQRGIVTPESAIEFMDFPHKEILLRRYREAESAKQKMMLEHPEFFIHGRGMGKKKS
jgi:hypothetical protein